MVVVRIVVFAAGFLLVAWTVMSAVRTVVLPRSASSAITYAVFRSLRVIFRRLASERRDYESRDRRMAMFAPLGLVTLAGTWLFLLLMGYMLMFWSLDTVSLGDAFHLSGSSITTLGFAPADTLAERILAFSAAGWGLFLVALVITYLPSLYSAFSRREEAVALLEVRAGSPPSATVFVLRHHRIGWLTDLEDTWLSWERWFAALEESHTSYPALAFFRSPDPARSWVTAAGTVLDAASMVMACVRGTEMGPPGVCVRSGYLALRKIADFFGIGFDDDPAPTDPISITRQEFDLVWEQFEQDGVPLVDDQDQAWRDFAGWRVNYDTVLLQLAEITMAPYAPWSSDRSAVTRNEPRVRRFGRRVVA